MFKTITAICVVINAVCLLANPVVPKVLISEVYPEGDQLKVELTTNFYSGDYSMFDSVSIKSNSSFVYLKKSQCTNAGIFFAVPDSLLTAPLILNRASDRLIVSTVTGSNTVTDEMSWGTGSSIPNLYQNQSIVSCPTAPINISMIKTTVFSKDNSPTKGDVNSTYTGTLSGYLLDSLNNRMPNKTVYLGNHVMPGLNAHYLALSSDNNGLYTVQTYSRHYSYDKIYMDLAYFSENYYTTTPGSFDIEPDSVTIHDFKILGCVGIEETDAAKNNQAVLFNYPNPANPATTIAYALPEQLNLKSARIEVVNTKGEQVAIYQLSDRKGSVIFDGNSKSSGLYTYRLMDGNTVLKSGSMVILK